MSTGCSIYFMPADGTWIGTPEFIRGLASWLELDKFELMRVYLDAPSTSESKPHPEQDKEKCLEQRDVSVDTVLELQRADARYTTVLSFGTTAFMDSMAEDVTTTLPESLSEGFAPMVGDIFNGPWKHYDYHTGEQRSDSSCCVILSNNQGYPVELDAYLAAFLKVPSVVRLQQRLEELAGQPWHALIDLT